MTFKHSALLAFIATVLITVFLAPLSGGSANEVQREDQGTSCVTYYKVSQFVPVSRNAWKRPNAPTDRYLSIFHEMYQCAMDRGHQVSISKVNKIFKHKFERLRLIKRVKNSCDRGDSYACIKWASIKEGVSYSYLVGLAECESGINPGAQNPSGASGLFQFMYTTFQDVLNRWEYGAKSIWSAKWNALAAAWKIARDGSGEWSCA